MDLVQIYQLGDFLALGLIVFGVAFALHCLALSR